MFTMAGLAASGRTTWVDKYMSENSDKQYNMVSPTTMNNRMTVKGEPRNKVHKWVLDMLGVRDVEDHRGY